jgi:methylenetetrahydrofolate reductase (NADPH)
MNSFQKAVRNGEFLITAEITPPKGGDFSRMLNIAQLINSRVHAINVTDGSRAVLRMSSVAASAILALHGIEPICQMTCRDRNTIALQSDLMGIHALGMCNVLALTGDPVQAGDHKAAKAVFDLESVRLLRLIGQLNKGVDFNGHSLTDSPLNLFPGAAVDPQLKSWSSLKRRFYRKLEAGAQFFQSQMITDFDRLDQFMDKVANGIDAPVLAGIFLLKSAKNADFINRNVPGVTIPEHIIQRLAIATDPLGEGVKIAAEQVRIARQLCQGVHLMAVKREDLILDILDLAGISNPGQGASQSCNYINPMTAA